MQYKLLVTSLTFSPSSSSSSLFNRLSQWVCRYLYECKTNLILVLYVMEYSGFSLYICTTDLFFSSSSLFFGCCSFFSSCSSRFPGLNKRPFHACKVKIFIACLIVHVNAEASGEGMKEQWIRSTGKTLPLVAQWFHSVKMCKNKID